MSIMYIKEKSQICKYPGVAKITRSRTGQQIIGCGTSPKLLNLSKKLTILKLHYTISPRSSSLSVCSLLLWPGHIQPLL